MNPRAMNFLISGCELTARFKGCKNAVSDDFNAMRWVMCGLIFLFGVAAAQQEDIDYFTVAEQAFKQKNYDKAVEAASKVIDVQKKNPEIFFIRARSYSVLNKPDLAIVDYNTVIKLAPKKAVAYHNRAIELFKSGYFKKAATDFDSFISLAPASRPHYWQRGIGLFYAGRFVDGRAQFELHQTVNSNDVENAVWHFLCVAKSSSIENARKEMLKIQNDSRVPMMAIYGLYKGMGSKAQILSLVENASDKEHSEFHAHLYLGLFEKLQGNLESAREHFTKAVAASKGMEFMGNIAEVEHRMLNPEKKKELILKK
jgi:lipoprotein NlpI